MKEHEVREEGGTGTTPGGRRPTEVVPALDAPKVRASGGEHAMTDDPVRRWTASRKQEVVLRLLRGEPIADMSRELRVEIYRLEKWRDRGLRGIQAGLKERAGDPLKDDLDAAMMRIGELSMENEKNGFLTPNEMRQKYLTKLAA